MTNVELAMIYARTKGVDLAQKLGVQPSYISQLTQGKRHLGPKNVGLVARALDVDEAWLLGYPQTLAILDPLSGTTYHYPIMRSLIIPDYGTLYHVVTDYNDIVPVIISNGIQFTPTDWQTLTVRTVDDIPDTAWLDARGHAAIMLDGLPRTIQ